MSTSATDEKVSRARELGLPTNVQPLFVDASVITAAIMDTLDRDDSIWDFDDKDVLSEAEATEERIKFVECVLNRILILQKPPFNLGVKLDPYCRRHLRGVLGLKPIDGECPGCRDERVQAQAAVALEKRRINDPD